MNKEFVPYEQALALKELGFDEPCLIKDTEQGEDCAIYYVHDNGTPTFSQAFRWFREKYKLFCWIEKFHVDETYIFQIPPANFTKIQGHYKTYEEAELECLIKLIELVKNK